MVGTLVKTGVIGQLAELAADATRGDALTAVMLILLVSAVLPGIIDNIPYVATMSPIVLAAPYLAELAERTSSLKEHRNDRSGASMSTVLIVDDDPQMLSVLRVAFTARGYQVVTETAGHAALRAASRTRPQVILLGTELSDMDGVDALVAMRNMTSAPIIALSACPDAEDVVRALDTGADDYVIKPFRIEELLARARAVIRRAAARPGGKRRGIVDVDTFTVDLDARKVWREGIEVHLTPNEWSVLEVLIQHEGHLVTQRELLRTIWGPEHSTDGQYIRVYIAQLRRKLEPEPANPRHLTTEHGQGYRFYAHRTDRADRKRRE